MKLSGLFNQEHITDQKRLARGEQLLYARTRLQARDVSFHKPWKILMTAGGAPKGEISAIRELMPKAHITAIDKNPTYLEAAIDAGADEIVECDLLDIEREGSRSHRQPCKELADLKFDLVDLDLCSNVNESTRLMAHLYPRIVNTRGIFMFSFSYGRDVLPAFEDAYWQMIGRPTERLKEIADKTGGTHVRNRLAYLFTPGMIECLHSVFLYKGASMPMCSLLFQVKAPKSRLTRPDVSVVKLEDGDFELAVVYPEAAKLYDCPQDRIESIRRKIIARRAVATRQARLLQ